MDYKVYLDLVENLDFIQQLKKEDPKSNVFAFLNKLREQYGKIPVESSVPVTAAVSCDDLIDAASDMLQPERYTKILDVLRASLKEDDLETLDKDNLRMLKLVTSYLKNAESSKQMRKWSLFGYYMRVVSYLIPQLISNLKKGNTIAVINACATDIDSLNGLVDLSEDATLKTWWSEIPEDYKKFICDNGFKIKKLFDNVIAPDEVDAGNGNNKSLSFVNGDKLPLSEDALLKLVVDKNQYYFKSAECEDFKRFKKQFTKDKGVFIYFVNDSGLDYLEQLGYEFELVK